MCQGLRQRYPRIRHRGHWRLLGTVSQSVEGLKAQYLQVYPIYSSPSLSLGSSGV